MARIVKGHDERLEEFLATARQLFFSQGYEKTTVQMILDRMGVAKGTFYHYFKSKEDLLDRMVGRLVDAIFNEIKVVVERTDLNAVKKLETFFLTTRQVRMENPDLVVTMVRHILSDRNLRFRDKYNQSMINGSLPLLERILAQGEKEGTFALRHRRYTAEILLSMLMYYGEVISLNLLDSVEKGKIKGGVFERMECLVIAMERILGIPEGSIHIVDKAVVRGFLKKLLNEEPE